MEYQLCKNNGDTTAVPALVLQRLAALTEPQLRAALAIARDGEVRPAALLAEFPQLFAGENELEKVLIYWAGAGLLVPCAGAPAAAAPMRPHPRPPRLSSLEIAGAAAADPQVSVLITEAQSLLGAVLPESDGNLLASLYLQDHLPVDMILTGLSHFVSKGKRNVRYIARVLLSWREDGIRTGADAERYLAILAQRERYEQEAAGLLGLPAEHLTAGERTMIDRWYEDYGYGREMILAAVSRAGDKTGVRYLSAMLKKWHAKNYRTPADLAAEGPANTQEASPSIAPADDLLLRSQGRVPTFKKRGER